MVLLKAVSDPKFSVEPMDVFWVGVERVQKSSIAFVYTKVDAPQKKVAMIDTICRAWENPVWMTWIETASTSSTRCPWWPSSSFYFAPFWRPKKVWAWRNHVKKLMHWRWLECACMHIWTYQDNHIIYLVGARFQLLKPDSLKVTHRSLPGQVELPGEIFVDHP